MYSKGELVKVRRDFWTAFGQYMKPVPSAEGYRVNWQNYKTGVKHIYFRLNAERTFASIGIEIMHADLDVQELFFQQFEVFQTILENELGEKWDWKLHEADVFGRKISKIEKTLPQVNIMSIDDWPAIISFLKPRIIALDAFWSNMKPAFEDL